MKKIYITPNILIENIEINGGVICTSITATVLDMGFDYEGSGCTCDWQHGNCCCDMNDPFDGDNCGCM